MTETLKKESLIFLDHTKEHLGDASIKTMVLEGDFSDSIIEAAGAIKADLIVMGTHSRRGIDKLLIGNLADKVLNHSKVPLFVIPTNNG